MSGLIAQHFIDELIARADIVEVIGARVAVKKAGREYKALCPFHGEKTPSFTISPNKGFYHCFGCGAHGTALSFLMEHDHLEFVEAVEELASIVGLEVQRDEKDQTPRPGTELYELLSSAEHYFRQTLKGHPAAVEYLKARGLDGDTAAAFHLGFAPDQWDALLNKLGANAAQRDKLVRAGLLIEKDDHRYDRFRNRIMFPIRDARGRTIAFGGRVLGSGEPKYLNSPETPLFQKGQQLYGLYEARQQLRNLDRLLVVEGYMDVVGLAQHSIHNVVATLGTATTRDHLRLLFRLTDEVVFCFDGDRAGRAAAWRALENALPLVHEGRQLRFLLLPDGHDPDSLVREEGSEGFQARQAEAIPLSNYLVEHLAAEVDLSSVDGRTRLVENARPLLARIAPGVYRELLIQRLGETIGLAPERLADLLDADTATAVKPRAKLTRRLSSGRPSLVRQAVSLLLHYPELAGRVEAVDELSEIDRPGVPLLCALIEDARGTPGLNTAGLLERWREREESQHLMRLAAVEILDDEQAAEAVFRDTLARLVSEHRQARMQTLSGKGISALSAAEKDELRALQRSQTTAADSPPP